MDSRIGLFCGIVAASFFTVEISAPTSAQVVHLPTTQVFSYSGSVLAPDRGTTSLGGSGSSRIYSSQFGRPRSRSLGSASSAGNTSVNAHIIDLDEIDRQIRGLSPAANTPNTSGSKVPPRTLRRSSTGRNPVAGIHASPHQGEVVDPKTLQRRRTFHDFTPGDYMMLLSHPGLAAEAHRSAAPVQAASTSLDATKPKAPAKPLAKKTAN